MPTDGSSIKRDIYHPVFQTGYLIDWQINDVSRTLPLDSITINNYMQTERLEVAEYKSMPGFQIIVAGPA